MNTSKLRNSTAIDKALAITAFENELGIKLESGHGDQLLADKPAPRNGASPGRENMTADHVAMYLRGVSANSSGQIDALVTDLQSLREKLVDDGIRVERDIVEFTTLNQSVIQLTKLISESIAQVKAPTAAE